MSESPLSGKRKLAYEYRLRWRREGRQASTRIYQTERAALRKADGILALETLREGSRWLEDMPLLTEKPIVEAREVAPWHALPEQLTEPTGTARDGMAEWLRWQEPDDDDWKSCDVRWLEVTGDD